MSSGGGIREALGEGLFYSGDEPALRREVGAYLGGESPACGESLADALITPHCRYPIGGPLMGGCYARVDPAVTRVLILASVHREPAPLLQLPAYEGFRTPLGTVPVDRQGVAFLSREGEGERGGEVSNLAFDEELSFELQLPFLQTRLEGDFTILPALFGAQRKRDLDRVSADFRRLMDDWERSGEKVLVVATSSGTARQSERHAGEKMERLRRLLQEGDPASLWDSLQRGDVDPCGGLPLYVLLRLKGPAGFRTLGERVVHLEGNPGAALFHFGAVPAGE